MLPSSKVGIFPAFFINPDFEPMQTSPLEQRIEAMLAPSLEAAGYGVVQVQMGEGARKRKSLILLAERTDGKPMGVDDCTAVSRTASMLLDVEDPITNAYDLEVSSPGMERPLTKPEDFTRFTGKTAKVECMRPIEGRKRFHGVLKGADGEEALIEVDGGLCRLAFSNIRKAALAPTDEDYAEVLKHK